MAPRRQQGLPIPFGGGRIDYFDHQITLNDGFESSDLSNWSSVATFGDGTATVQTTTVKTGTYAAALGASANPGSASYVRRQVTPAQTDLSAAGDLIVTAEGATNSNVPVITLLDGAGNGVVSLYRQNHDSDKLWIQAGGAYNATTGTLPLNTWGRLEVRATLNGAGTDFLEARLNGNVIFTTSAATLGATGNLATLQLGQNVPSQAFSIVADNILLTSRSAVPPGPVTAIQSGPAGVVPVSTATFQFTSSAPNSSFTCSLDAAAAVACLSPTTYNGLSAGSHTFRVQATDTHGTTDPNPPIATWTVNLHKLLIADEGDNRLLITDFSGRPVWEFDNPNGRGAGAGPLGVRWQPNNQILATFGTGEVGLIDVASKSWVWQTSGYNQVWFQSPYDAELLPDGNLAVAVRFNDTGRVTVYNRTTGATVWNHLLSNAHAVHFRSVGYNTTLPTLLIGGWGTIAEVAYQPNSGETGQTVTWSVNSTWTHDVIPLPNDQLLSTEGQSVQKIDRLGSQLWTASTPDGKHLAINPDSGYIDTQGHGNSIEFRDLNGILTNAWTTLTNGSPLNYPYGIQVVDFSG